jgi:hypothetical protein
MGTGLANALGVQWGQMTPAQQVLGNAFMGGKKLGTATGKRRRKSKSAKRAAPRRAKRAKTSRRRKTAARLVKGSAAAKRYMASIRRKRK